MASAKQKAAARRNIKKAQKARKKMYTGRAFKGGGSGKPKIGHAHPVAKPRKKRRTAKQKAASKRKSAKRSKPRKSGKRRSRRGPAQVIVTRSRGKRRNQVTVKTGRPVRIVKVPGKTRIVRVAAERRRHKGRRRARETYAMENPMGAMEIAVGVVTGALGFLTMLVVDRFIATHALTDKNAKDAAGNELYSDSPPAATGTNATNFLNSGYAGLMNGAAVDAPMNLARWGAGVLIPGVAIGAASFIKSPAGRSATQMFGFGAAMKTAGKALTDLAAMLTAKTAVGQRLLVNEARAAALKAEGNGGTATVPSASLPSTGLGRVPQMQAGTGSCCGGCASGGSCQGNGCRGKTQVSPPTPPPPPPPPQNLTGPMARPATLAAPAQEPAKPARSRFNWGYDGAE